MLNGIDVSSNQPANIGELVEYDFMIVKVGGNPNQGGMAWNYINEYWRQQADTALSKGKRLGLYWFAYGKTPEEEGDLFCDQMRSYKGKAIPIIDWEGPVTQNGTAWLGRLIDVVKSRLGVVPMVYAGASDVQVYGLVEFLRKKNSGVWSANYWLGSQKVYGYSYQDLINDVPEAAMWQYTGTGRLNGYDGNLDLNVFYGDGAAWDAYAKAGTDNPAPPQEDVTGKSVAELGELVLAGAFGNGRERRDKLGSVYNGVQAWVDWKMGYAPDYEAVADEVMAGAYGNGKRRMELLADIYGPVQDAVNWRYAE